MYLRCILYTDIPDVKAQKVDKTSKLRSGKNDPPGKWLHPVPCFVAVDTSNQAARHALCTRQVHTSSPALLAALMMFSFFSPLGRSVVINTQLVKFDLST